MRHSSVQPQQDYVPDLILTVHRMYIRLHYNVEVILHYAVLHYIMYEIQHSYNIIFY